MSILKLVKGDNSLSIYDMVKSGAYGTPEDRIALGQSPVSAVPSSPSIPYGVPLGDTSTMPKNQIQTPTQTTRDIPIGVSGESWVKDNNPLGYINPTDPNAQGFSDKLKNPGLSELTPSDSQKVSGFVAYANQYLADLQRNATPQQMEALAGIPSNRWFRAMLLAPDEQTRMQIQKFALANDKEFAKVLAEEQKSNRIAEFEQKFKAATPGWFGAWQAFSASLTNSLLNGLPQSALLPGSDKAFGGTGVSMPDILRVIEQSHPAFSTLGNIVGSGLNMVVMGNAMTELVGAFSKAPTSVVAASEEYGAGSVNLAKILRSYPGQEADIAASYLDGIPNAERVYEGALKINEAISTASYSSAELAQKAMMGVTQAISGANQGEDFKTVLMDFGIGFASAAAGFKLAKALKLDIAKISAEAATKSRLATTAKLLAQNTVFTIGQSVADPRKLEEYINRPGQFLVDMGTNLLYFFVSAFMGTHPVPMDAEGGKMGKLYSDFTKSVEELRGAKDFESASEKMTRSADALVKELVKIDPESPEAKNLQATVELLKNIERNENVKVEEAPQEGNGPRGVQNEPAQVQGNEEAQVNPNIVLRRGEIDKKGAYFSSPGSSTYYDTENPSLKSYDISSAKIAESGTNASKAILRRALKDANNTPEDISRIKENLSDGYIDYLMNDEIPSIVKAAKELGYDGIKVWENDDIDSPSSLFIWNTDKAKSVSPEQVNSNQEAQVAPVEATRSTAKVDFDTPEAKNLVKTPEDRKAVEDFVSAHENDTKEQLHENTLNLLSQITSDNGSLLKVNLQLFAMKNLLSDKMGVDNVSKVLERVFGGSDLSRLTPEAIDALELRSDNHLKYTPLVVTYEKIVNQEVWDAATKRIETEQGQREILQKYESGEIPTAEEVAATLQLAEKLLSSTERSDIILGSEILARLSNKASRMGQAIEILSKAYAEMGILNGVKSEMNDAVPGMKRRELAKGTKELRDKAKKDLIDLINNVFEKHQAETEWKATDIQVENAWKEYERNRLREELKAEHEGDAAWEWTQKQLDEIDRQVDKSWNDYAKKMGSEVDSQNIASWVDNYKKEHANDKYTAAPDTRVTPAERLAKTLDAIAKEKYQQGPEQNAPLVNLVSELVRMVRENHPELGRKLKETNSAMDNIMFLVKNRKEYGKMLDDAFAMIEESYRADPTKYPRDFIEEMHKYLNDVAEIRPARYDAAVRQVLDETGMTLKELIVDWMNGDKKLQTFLDYIREKSTLSPEESKYLVDEMQKRLDVMKEEKRSSILRNMFRDVKRGNRKTLEDKYMEALGLGVITDSVYGDIWAKKMGISYFSPEMAADIQKTMHEYFAIDENAIYQTGEKGTKGISKTLHTKFGSQYDGASEAPGWYLRQQMYDSLIERMSAHIPLEAWGRVESFLYSSMLSGFNSWVKNPAANVIMSAASRLADIPNAAFQSAFVKPENRTISGKSLIWMRDEGLKKTVADVFERKALPSIKAEGLEAGIARVLQRNRRTFNHTKVGDVLETVNKVPMLAMEYGDIPFLRSHFEDALGKYMTARNTKTVTNEAYQFAYDRALEDTFRDQNILSYWINSAKKLDTLMPEIRKLNKEIESAKTDELATQAQTRLDKLLYDAWKMKVVKQALLPFVNTTVNVARRMIEYSPYGAFDIIGKQIRNAKTNKKFNGAELSRDISKILMGTFAVGGLGWLFSWLGNGTGMFSINGAYPSDASEKKRWQIEGRQPYSIGIKMPDGRVEYVTLDWATPAVAPFFMGAMTEQNIRNNGLTFKSVEDATIQGMDALWQMSFIQSLNNLLGGYGTPTQKAVTILLGLPGQAIPNWMSRLNYVIDDTVRVYPSDSQDIAKAAINNLIRKLPGGTMTLQPKLDAWGNELKQGQINPSLGAFGRFLNAYLAPYRVYNGTVGKETDEVIRVYRAARDAGESGASYVLPDFSGLTLPAEDLKQAALTADEVTELNRIAGKLARERLASEMKTPEWSTLPDYSKDGGSKYDAIRRIYSDAEADARAEVEKKRGITPKKEGTPSYLSISQNGKTTNYTISETKYQQYYALSQKYKAEGYTNYDAAAKSEILRGMGYNVPLVTPKKAYKVQPTPEIVDTRGG